jgi:hypothetical protein
VGYYPEVHVDGIEKKNEDVCQGWVLKEGILRRGEVGIIGVLREGYEQRGMRLV